MGSTVAGVALAALASVMFNAAIVIQAREARQVSNRHGLRLSLLRRLLVRRRWLMGTALGATAFPLQTLALLLAPLTAVQPADATGLLVLLFLGSRVLGERVGGREIAAVAAIVVGIVVLTLAAPEREVTKIEGVDVLLPLIGVAAVALLPFALRRWLGTHSMLVVVAAGFAFALAAFCAKLVADALSDARWLALVVALAVAALAALAGTVSEQTALQRRPATAVAPVIFAIELLVPVALAVVVVGEDWGASSVPGIAAALALVTAGSFALGRTPSVAKMIEASSRE
jgi:drug/metabolite transporter (DMT)-like permease